MGDARPAGPGFSPLDKELGLGPWAATPTLVEGMTRMGAAVPFREAAEHVRFFTGTCVAESTLRRITERIGAGVVAAQEAEAEAIARDLPDAPEPEGPVLQLSVDGAMAPTIGAGKTEWVEVKTMAIGVVSTRQDAAGKQEVVTEKLTYFSRSVEAERFAKLALVETQRRGLERAERVGAVNDGAEWCQSFVDLHRPDARRVLDYSHAADAVDEAAKAVCGETSEQAKERSAQWRELLRRGEEGEVVEVMAEAAAEAEARAGGAGEVVAGKVAYLAKRREQITYTAFEREGLPIGSGAVESAHKTQVQRRLKGAGMRWERENIDRLCALANARSNERWGEALVAGIEQVRAQGERATAERRRERGAGAAPASPGADPAPAPELSPQSLPANLPDVSATRAAGRRGPWVPPPDHPWRRPFKGQGRKKVA